MGLWDSGWYDDRHNYQKQALEISTLNHNKWSIFLDSYYPYWIQTKQVIIGKEGKITRVFSYSDQMSISMKTSEWEAYVIFFITIYLKSYFCTKSKVFFPSNKDKLAVTDSTTPLPSSIKYTLKIMTWKFLPFWALRAYVHFIVILSSISAVHLFVYQSWI